MAKRKSSLFDWVKIILIAFALAYIVRTFVVSPIIVTGESMEPTLNDQDHMIVNKLNYRFSEPKRFDIVIFHTAFQRDFIKRVIALPGEHVAVKDNTLYIDGEAIEEPYIDKANSRQYTDDFTLEELPGGYDVVPEGYVFVLGDHRKDSTDSRSNSLGLVEIEEIVGKASIIYWPFSRIQITK